MKNDFVDRAQRHASQWKATCPDLPEGARGPAAYLRAGKPVGMYGYCLPAPYAGHNLLPAVRESALREFASKGIVWHAQTPVGPTNHLLSSQIQCVNALEPLATDAEAVIKAFDGVLPIREPLEIEPGRLVAFEYIGERSYLGEWPAGGASRGAHCTSADAAIRYRALDGTTEIALIEWKYTEDYRGHRLSPDKRHVRPGRYQALWDAADSPLRSDLIPYDDMFVEPFYQLMRQQLLAHEMEKAREGEADVVRVVHVSPAGNTGLRGSLNRDSHRAVAADVFDVWRSLLRAEDRFISLDSSRFVEVGSAHYRNRYDHP